MRRKAFTLIELLVVIPMRLLGLAGLLVGFEFMRDNFLVAANADFVGDACVAAGPRQGGRSVTQRL